MSINIGAGKIEIIEGEITEQVVDAIVNAANTQLAAGGGVNGAILRAGGPEILAECRALGGCPTGQAVATGAGSLPAKKIIHTVGPVWREGEHGEAALLASAYRSAFQLAQELGLRTVAVPSLSTGAFGYPMDHAARIACSTAVDFLSGGGQLQLIRFVLLGPEARRVFQRTLEDLAPTQVIRIK